jgi:hypothetical protein
MLGRIAFAILLILLVMAPITASPASAQTGGSYGLTWSTVDAGGGSLSTGGVYTLGGTAGQPEGGTGSSGGSLGLAGGFWAGVVAAWRTYIPMVVR